MKNSLIGLTLLFLIGCNPPPIKNEKKPFVDAESSSKSQTGASYIIALSKIDNNVNIYIEDSLIYTSGTIHESPEVDFQVDLSQFIVTGDEEIKIELLNGVEPYNEQIDPLWEVKYDLVINNEIVDFIHEYGDDNAIGKVYENTYIINDWIE